MSLNIYTSKDKIPSDIEYIRINDEFFNKFTHLSDDNLCIRILKEFEKAEYCSENTFIGINKEAGAIDRRCLSTRVKTVLNIINNPDKCFDLCEVGDCYLWTFILGLTEGYVLWENLFLLQYMSDDDSCDVNLNGMHFIDVDKMYKFARIINEGDFDWDYGDSFALKDYYMDGDKVIAVVRYADDGKERVYDFDELLENL